MTVQQAARRVSTAARSTDAVPQCRAVAPARPQRVVVLLGAKLIGLDSVLPIVMALKEEAPEIEVVFLFLNGRVLDVVAKNYVLDRGMRATGRVAVLSDGRGGVLGKLRAGVRLASWALSLRQRSTWLFSYTDAAEFPVHPLAKSARRGGGSVLLYAKAAHPGSAALRAAHRSKEQRQSRDMTFRDPGDVFLLYHPDQVADYADFTQGPATSIGSPRSYPVWRRWLDRVQVELGVRDEAGCPIDLTGGSVLALFYSGDVEIPTQTDQPRKALARILAAVARAAPQATVLIKPHPNCDLDQLREDIAKHGAVQVHITHAHPQILARAATAAIFNNGSNAMNDVYIEGTPVIETSVYRAEILAYGPSLYPNHGRLDGAQDEDLEAWLRQIVADPSSLPTPDAAPLIWPKPSSLFETISRQGAPGRLAHA